MGLGAAAIRTTVAEALRSAEAFHDRNFTRSGYRAKRPFERHYVQIKASGHTATHAAKMTDATKWISIVPFLDD
jgi:hypothetical protein